ncbi:MAG: TonB-dependent receptor [Nevskia sp.]|nr:TonB-dependent receptor [Nevskia sp.]
MSLRAWVMVCVGLYGSALAPAAALAADGGTDTQELKEVIVTAQKMRQTLEQVPASVSSMDGDFIRSTGVRSYAELQNYTANTNLQVSPSSTQLLIRGLGTLNDVPGLDPSVGVVVDGVVYTYPEYLTAFFYDLDRYEVLRGPQGTLFGKNVTAGLLNITTSAPEDQLLIHSEYDMRSNGNRAFRPVINLPLGPGLALRASGNFEHGDRGTLFNTDLDRREVNPQQDSGRLRLRYDSGAGWTMDLGYFVSHQEQNFDQQQLFILSPEMFALDRHYDPRFTAQLDDTTSENVPGKEAATTRGGWLAFNGDLGHPGGMSSLKITSITGVAENLIGARDLDADFSPVPFIRDSLVTPETERQFTQELRVSGAGPDLFGLGHKASFVAGLYYDNYTLSTSDDFMIEDLGAAAAYLLAAQAPGFCNSHPLLCGPGGIIPPGNLGTIAGDLGGVLSQTFNLIQQVLGQPLIPQQSAQSGLMQRTKDYAAFGQGEWFFTRHWALIGGLRYAKENRKGEPHSFSSSQLIKAIAGQQDFDLHLQRTETDFSPKAGIKYQPSVHTEGYFTWAQGYKSGGFNGRPLNPQSIEYQPEKATSFEAGFKIKDRLFDGPIRGSISLYRTHFSNLQVSTFQGTNVIVVNAAAARSQGFEADLMWLLPVRGLSLYSSFGFADARYLSYPNGLETGDGRCATGKPGPQSGTCDLTGARLPFAPQWTAALTPAYRLHLPWSVSAGAAVDLLYQGDRYLNSEDDPRQLQKQTLLINPRLVFADDVAGDWALTLGIQNLTKQVYSDQVIDQPLAPGNFAAIRIDRGRFYTANFFINFR